MGRFLVKMPDKKVPGNQIKMDKEKLKPILKVIWGIVFIFFVMPSLLALVSTIGFWVLYLSLTHPILAEYQSQWTFRVGMMNVAFGICVSQIIIIFKSLDYVFGVKEKQSEDLRTKK